MFFQCDPNLQVYNVFIDNLDERLPRITFFAKRGIKAGEELTFDYKMTGRTFFKSFAFFLHFSRGTTYNERKKHILYTNISKCLMSIPHFCCSWSNRCREFQNGLWIQSGWNWRITHQTNTYWVQVWSKELPEISVLIQLTHEHVYYDRHQNTCQDLRFFLFILLLVCTYIYTLNRF